MEDQQFLKYFINEEIYIIPGDIPEDNVMVSEERSEEKAIETKEEPIKPEKKDESSQSDEKKIAEVANTSETSEEKENSELTKPSYTPPVYAGHFVKKVLVLVHSKSLKFDHMDLLEKILNSIGMQKEDVAILPSGHLQSKEDFDWVNQLDKVQTFMFGLPDKWMQQFHDNTEKYVNHQTSKGRLMFIDSLPVLNQEVALKKKLWAELKAING